MSDQDRVAVCLHRTPGYAKGGLVSAAHDVAKAGVGGDTMIVHVNRDEFAKMHKVFGAPTINPHTGMPQFSTGWLGPIAGVLGSLLGGDALGGIVSNVTGGAISGTAANALGSGLLGAGVGGLTGGGQGALYGGLAGAATPYLSGLLGGGASAGGSGGGGLLSGLLGGGSSGTGGTTAPKGIGSDTVASMNAPSGAGQSSGGGLFGNLNAGQKVGLLAGALTLANALGNKSNAPNNAAQQAAQAASQARFNAPLPQANFSRQRVQPTGDPNRYGMSGGQNYFTNNQLGGTTPGAARGGLMAHVRARTPSRSDADGRSDNVLARLSPDEYVVDAETVGMLGNGSSSAGAKRLDKMRQNVRAHKGGALVKGNFSPNAKSPEQYMSGGRV